MSELQLIPDLAIAVLAAFAGGVLAQRLGQSVIVGYLLAGLLIGPLTPGLTAHVQSVQVLAQIGVAFLMFSLGAEFSRDQLRQLGRVATIGMPVQLVLTTGLGLALAPVLGASLLQGIYLGALLALSSTIVGLKVLMSRGETESLHGRTALGILIAQDIAVIPMVVVLPALAHGSQGWLPELGLTLIKAAAVVAVAYLVGVRAVPWLLGHFAVPNSRELFLLGTVALALGAGMVSQLVGLSLPFGAFLAGLVIAESQYRAQVVADVLPLRDLFASLFFVSVGMLINPTLLAADLWQVALLAAVVIAGKVVIVTVIVRTLRMPGRVALLTGLNVAQVGEFSFVLGAIGVAAGALPSRFFELVLLTAFITIVATPFLIGAAPGLLAAVRWLPILGRWFNDPVEHDPTSGDLRGHTVICGFGRVGRELGAVLDGRRLTYLVVDYSRDEVLALRARGVPAIYGDAANPAVLAHTGLEHARALAVLIPDSRAAALVTRYARQVSPRLDIVTRIADIREAGRLRAAGASEVVQPEFEAGIEVIAHIMRGYGVTGAELARIVDARRSALAGDAEGIDQAA